MMDVDTQTIINLVEALEEEHGALSEEMVTEHFPSNKADREKCGTCALIWKIRTEILKEDYGTKI
jgi:hypothetical protein